MAVATGVSRATPDAHCARYGGWLSHPRGPLVSCALVTFLFAQTNQWALAPFRSIHARTATKDTYDRCLQAEWARIHAKNSCSVSLSSPYLLVLDKEASAVAVYTMRSAPILILVWAALACACVSDVSVGSHDSVLIQIALPREHVRFPPFASVMLSV